MSIGQTPRVAILWHTTAWHPHKRSIPWHPHKRSIPWHPHKRSLIGWLPGAALIACHALAACQPRSAPEQPAAARSSLQSPAAGPAADIDPSQRVVYVPAYSHITSRESGQTLLSVTLSVRNVDPSAAVTLTAVDYFNTAGARVRRYLEQPVTLKPLATAEYIVSLLDETGGSGANFLVQWSGPPQAHPLLTETVMVGHAGQGYLSFTSRGVELSGSPEAAADL